MNTYYILKPYNERTSKDGKYITVIWKKEEYEGKELVGLMYMVTGGTEVWSNDPIDSYAQRTSELRSAKKLQQEYIESYESEQEEKDNE